MLEKVLPQDIKFHTDQIRINDRYVTLTSGMSLEKSLLYGSRDRHIHAFTSNSKALLNPMIGFAVMNPEKIFTDGELSWKNNSLKLAGDAHYVAWYGEQTDPGVRANFCLQTDLSSVELRTFLKKCGMFEMHIVCNGSTLHKYA